MLFRSQNRGLDGRPDLGETRGRNASLREGSFSRKRTDKLGRRHIEARARPRPPPSAEGLTESPAAIRANAMSQIMGAIGVEGERDVSLPPVNAVVARRSSSGRRHSTS